MIRRALFWPLFAALAALLAYGLWANALFAQPVWTTEGARRLAIYAALSALWIPLRKPVAVAWIALVYATAIAGPMAVGSVLLFLVSSWCVGRVVTTGVPAMMAGASAYALIIGLAVHAPVNYAAVYVAVMAAPLVWRWRDLAKWRVPACNSRMAGLLLALLGIHLLMALKPEASTDGLAVHLAVPASIADHHQWAFDFRHTTWSLMPLTADYTYTAVYLPGGAAAARLLNFAYLAAAVAMLCGLLRRVLTPPMSLLFCSVYAASPILLLVTGSLFVENFWTAVLLAGFVCEAPWAAAILLGTGIATKYGAISFVLPVAFMRLRRAPAAVAALLLFAAPPYVRAYLESGNPVFPFLNQVFHSPYFQTKPFVDTRFQRPLTPTTLYDITFHTSQFLESQDGGWTFAVLFFLPLALLLATRATWFALAVSLVFAVASFAAQSNVRYLCPVLPLFVYAAGGATSTLKGARRHAMIAAAAVLIALNTWFLSASGWYHKSFDRTPEDPAPAQTLIGWLNRTHRGEPVAFVENSHIAGLIGRAYVSSWHNNAYWQKLRFLDSARACGDMMRGLGIRLFLTPKDASHISQPAMRQFLLAYSIPEAEYGGWQVRRLVDTPQWMTEGVAPGVYDDMDPHIEYEGIWDGDRQFPQPAGGSITYSSVRGALFRLRFRGTSITYVYTKAANRGKAEIIIDGVRREPVDLHSIDTQWQERTTFNGLPNGVHTFEVRVPAEAYVDVDQLIVR